LTEKNFLKVKKIPGESFCLLSEVLGSSPGEGENLLKGFAYSLGEDVNLEKSKRGVSAKKGLGFWLS